MDDRVQAFLDDKLQSTADLDTLDSLLENIKSQQDLLQAQLDEARSDHDEAGKKARTCSVSVKERAQVFQKEQSDIDRRLMIVTQSDTSDDAARKFQASMDKLRRLEITAGYVQLLTEVDALCSECTSKLAIDNDAALEPYRELQHLVSSLQPLQEAAEGAAPHLLDHISQRARNLQQTVQKSFSDDLDKTLAKMNWPKLTDTVPAALQKEWSINIRRLLNLQRPHLDGRELQAESRHPAGVPPVLFPFEVLVKPMEQRFAYHFSGNKPTNRLDKPEYFLSQIIDLVNNYSDFLQSAVQPLLIEQFRGSDLAYVPAYIDATSAFITALLPMLRKKLSSVTKQVAHQPQLFSHLMHEVMSFDITMQETFAYAPASPAQCWRGMAFFILDNCGYFDQWVTVERDFALARYESIIESPEAGELDFDSLGAENTKPTKAAIRVNDLLETITDRYRPLTSFSQKLRFLMDIQIAIFDQFHVWLHSSLEAYLMRTSAFARSMQGVSREEQIELQGVKGIDRLCRVFGSAEYLERAMRDWSDDVFFLELWSELQFRARNREQISRNLGALHEIQSKTSAAVGAEDDEDETEGALFDETAAAYHRLRVRSESIMVETLATNTREALKPYARVNTWASISSSAVSGSTTAELDTALRLLQDYLSFISRALGRAPLRRVGRQLSHAIQSYIWDNVLVRHSFSTAGATQLATDIGAIAAMVDRFVGPGQSQSGMRKLLEGVKLISLPVRSEVPETLPSRAGDSDEDEEAAWGEANGTSSEGQQRTMGLFEVERLVFMDNESARRALDMLGLDALDGNDARAVLEKRIELHS